MKGGSSSAAWSVRARCPDATVSAAGCMGWTCAGSPCATQQVARWRRRIYGHVLLRLPELPGGPLLLRFDGPGLVLDLDRPVNLGPFGWVR